MPRVNVLSADAATEVDAEIRAGRVVVNAADVATAVGWDLKPEGLCRGDVCVPVRDDAGVRVEGGTDLGAVADLLGMATLVDEAGQAMAISAPAADRKAALKGRLAPDFSLPDLDGTLHSLEQYKDRKRLLIAFASW
jgi:hypothetical protein